MPNLRKTLLFLALNAAAALAVLGFLAATRPRLALGNADTQTNLPLIPRDAHFPLLIMGPSHGRIFSDHGNHARIEAALGTRMLNLSQGRGGGVMPMDLYLSYFYRRGNRADCLVFFMHPFIFGSPVFNEDHDRLREEPFRLDFAVELVRKGYPAHAIVPYIQRKFFHPGADGGTRDTLGTGGDWRRIARIAPDSLRIRDENMYPDGFTPARLARYLPYLEDMLALAEAHGTRVILAFPPTLLGDQRGMDEVKAALARLRERHDFVFRDWHQAIRDLEWFGDLDHLNTPGLIRFARNYLGPLIAASDPDPDPAPP